MIKQAQKEDTEQIKRLWRKTLNDSDDKINIFLDNYLNNIFVFKQNRKISGMMSVLPLYSADKTGGYIYAESAETPEVYSRLSEYAYRYIKENGGSFSVVVPRDSAARERYRHIKYSDICAVEEFEYDNAGFPGKATEVNKISPQILFRERHDFFGKEKIIEWDLKELDYAWRIWGGNFFEIRENENISYAVCTFSSGMLDIKEMFGTVDTTECIAALGNLFNAAHIRAAIRSDNHPSAMVYPGKYKNCYFNIAID